MQCVVWCFCSVLTVSCGIMRSNPLIQIIMVEKVGSRIDVEESEIPEVEGVDVAVAGLLESTDGRTLGVTVTRDDSSLMVCTGSHGVRLYPLGEALPHICRDYRGIVFSPPEDLGFRWGP